MDKNLTLEINPNHEIISKLNALRKTNLKVASMIARQILDNTMVSAGLVSDTKSYVNRVNKLLLHVLEAHKGDTLIEEH